MAKMGRAGALCLSFRPKIGKFYGRDGDGGVDAAFVPATCRMARLRHQAQARRWGLREHANLLRQLQGLQYGL